jgi:phage gp29-like protein
MSVFSKIKNNLPFWAGGTYPALPQLADSKKNLANYISPVQLQRLRQDVKSWRDVLAETENVWFPHRVKIQQLFVDTINNGHVAACMERRKDLTMLRKWEFVDKNGKVDQTTTDYFLDCVAGRSQNKDWFNKFLNYALDSIFYGYSLIALNDITNDEFNDLDLIKRWNVSPDRLNVTDFIYSISGAEFEQEPYANWHVYVPTYNEIGTSPAGYGLLYKVALYEIFLRNIMGYNADFVELYAQPFRVGKTTKSKESERSEFANAIQQMGSNGWALIDPEDEISFLEVSTAGTGFLGYDNLEQRCEKKISKLILGHADALDSTPGKLGSSSGESPAQSAMNDKATKDGSFVSNVMNKLLIPKMRNLGFAIPEGIVAVLKNDFEIEDIKNTIIAQAVEMKSAGLQMDATYFTKQTGIPVSKLAN